MTTHNKGIKSSATPATNRSLDIFNAAQPRLNQAVVSSVADNQLDANMFAQTVQKRTKLQKDKKISQQSFGEQANELLQQNEEVNGRIDNALANPFHDLMAFFNGEQSVEDMANEQKRLSLQMSRVHSNNTATSAAIDDEIKNTEQSLKDQLGFTKLINEGKDRTLLDLQSVSKAEKALTDFETSRLTGKSLDMLRLELKSSIAGSSKFRPGTIQSVINAKENELLDVQNKKFSNRGKQPKAIDVLKTITQDELFLIRNQMQNTDTNFKFIQGVRVTKADVVTELGRKQTVFDRDMTAFSDLSTNAMIANSFQQNAEDFASAVDIESLPMELQIQANAIGVLIQDHEARKEAVIADPENGENARRLIISGKRAGDALNAVKERIADTKSKQVLSDEEGQGALKRFYLANGRFTNTKDSLSVVNGLHSGSTPEAIGSNAGATFQNVITRIATRFSDRQEANFDNNFKPAVNRAGSASSAKKKSISIEDFLAGGPSNRNLSAIEWQRTLREETSPKLQSVGAEKNKWKELIVQSVFSTQLQFGLQEFLKLDGVKLQDNIRNALTTTGGGIKPGLLDANNSAQAIADILAEIAAKGKTDGLLDDQTNFAAQFINIMKSDAILNIANRAFDTKDPYTIAVFTGIYGDRGAGSIAGGYLGKYDNQMSAIDITETERKFRLDLIKARDSDKSFNEDIFGRNLIQSNIGSIETF